MRVAGVHKPEHSQKRYSGTQPREYYTHVH
jgi:hypothetical protein